MSKKVIRFFLKFIVLAAGVILFNFPANPAADPLFAANNFVDRFEAGADNWSAIRGSWAVEGEEYSQSNLGDGGNFTVIKGMRWGDATYDFDMRVINNGGSSANWAGFQFKKMLLSDSPFESGFLIYATASGDVVLYKVNKVLASASTGLNFTTAKHMKIVNSGKNIKVYVNNEATPRINYDDGTFASGYAGLVTFNSHWHFDNVNISGSDLPYAINIGSSQLLYDDAHMPTHTDGSFATLKYDATTLDYFMVNSIPPVLHKYRGPLDVPLQTNVFNESESTYIRKNGYDTGYCVYEIWIMNFYKVSSNELIGFAHIEKYPNGETTRSVPIFGLGIAISTDNGSTWDYCGEILKPKSERMNVGGVPYIIKDGYFYVYYNDGEQPENSIPYPKRPCVARALVQDVINASRNHQVSTWYKYKNGSWNGNAFTDMGTPIIDITYGMEDTHSDAVYCSAINKYLLTIQTHSSSRLCLYSSSDGINFSMEAIVDSATPGSCMQPYSTFEDLTGASDDCSTVDEDFYIMYPRKAWTNYMYDDLYRRHITIATNTGDQYSAESGFSTTQGVNQWYYKQWDGSSYTDMTWDSTNNRWKGTQTYCIAAASWQHPDVNDSIRVWKAPMTGKVWITGTAKKADTAGAGDGVNVKIMKGSTQIWPASGWQFIAYNDFTGVNHDFMVNVAQNDEIYFIVNKNGNNTNDTVCWNPSISYVDTTKNVYNSSNDFGMLQGGNGWYYQQLSSGSYSDMTGWTPGDNRWYGQTYCISASDWQHPDTNNDSVKAWKAPKNGTVTITGKARKGLSANLSGDGVRIKILKNSTQLWPGSGWQSIAFNDTTGVTHSISTTVTEGDILYFIVNMNSNIACDQTDWDITITYN